MLRLKLCAVTTFRMFHISIYPGCSVHDGDEVNVHLPQGPHVETEISELIGVPEQIVTGQSSHPVTCMDPTKG